MGQTDATTTPEKKEIHSLRSLCTVVMMFLVFIKYDVPYAISNVIYSIGRFAIPIYAMISGYFCFSKDGHTEKRLPQKAMHILFLIIFLKVFYLITEMFYCFGGYIDITYLLTSFITSEKTTQHIWFVYALFMIYVFWILLNRHNISYRKTLPLIFIILGADILFGEILEIMNVPFVVDNDIGDIIYPFMTLPFFIIGYHLHNIKEKIDEKVSTALLLLIFVASIIGSVLEGLVVTTNLYISTIPAAISLFLLCFRVPEDKGRIKPLIYAGKNLSAWMYIYCMAAVMFTQTILLEAQVGNEFVFNIIGPFIAIFLDVLMAFVTFKILSALTQRKTKEPSVC